MNQQEINNFTRMADALEEEIFRLRKDLNESETLVDVLQRELHDARQELKIAHLEKDIVRLEKLTLENRLKEVEESLFRESLKKHEKIPNPYPQPSITPCPTPWDPWQQPWYKEGRWYCGDTTTTTEVGKEQYTTTTNNTGKVLKEGDVIPASNHDEDSCSINSTVSIESIDGKSAAEMTVLELMEAFWGNE